jgi:hypothetical protein
MQRRKYGNKKIEVNGIKFDSKLEHDCYNYLKLVKADFDFQHKIILQEGFRHNGKAIRAITMIVDFVVRVGDMTYYVDTKGYATESSKIKYKMLKYRLKDEENSDVIWLETKGKIKEFINSKIIDKL